MNQPPTNPRTLFEKIWENHIVVEEPDAPTVLYIDLHLIHEVTSPQAFTSLRERGLKVRRPEQTMATMDHCTPTTGISISEMTDLIGQAQLKQIIKNCEEFGIKLFTMGSPNNGIVHVVAPERGFTQPGMTIVCGDSHTSTHGAFGALAFGIGTSEVEHVLASQCLLQKKPKSMEVKIDGRLGEGISAKDVILALIAEIGTGGGTGHVIEYTGSLMKDLSMEERMTICNMTIEGGARSGIVAPDETTFEYLAGRDHVPEGADWEDAVERWKKLPSDDDARYERCVSLDVENLAPMITYGTNPGMGMEVNGRIPKPEKIANTDERQTLEKALDYMDLKPGMKLLDHPIDVVFVGSCTNSRLSDLRQAAMVIKSRRVAEGVRMLVVPGSREIKLTAEAEGLDRIFLQAGAEWREPGCSMCLAMNGDQLEPGQYGISTSNRNFEGRQGKGGRTFLASPMTAAASAVNGRVTDVRTMLRN